MQLTLLKQQHPLAIARNQVRLLEDPTSGLKSFAELLRNCGCGSLRASPPRILQINIGKRCNQTCSHCHVDAGPSRREMMSRETLEACLRVVREASIELVDITGGAPEMHPDFRWFVSAVRRAGCQVIDRCNLTILVAAGYCDVAEFLAEQRVAIVASLPCYLAENTDKQRGNGVFAQSIESLQRLNSLGYGQPSSDLELTLVYNPVGPTLPPPQQQLEDDYRRELNERYGIKFTRLFTVTNMPISRFLEELLRTGRYHDYMDRLISAFNSQTLDGLMCRDTLSVDWQGNLYDCDFNQMLGLPVATGQQTTIRDLDSDAIMALTQRPIVTGRHCFGCTAGAGSSCQGSLA